MENRKRIEAVLAEIGEHFRPDLISSSERRSRAYADQYVKSNRFWKPRLREFGESRSSHRDIALDDLRGLIDFSDKLSVGPNVGYRFAEGQSVDDYIRAKAEEYAEAILTDFVGKVSAKLSKIVEAKPEAKIVLPVGDIGYNRILFTFPDGSGFTVQNQIVHVWNRQGTHFTRYPLTFHNVRFPDGSNMKTPSEAKVKKAFAGIASPPPKGPVVHRARSFFGFRAAYCVSSGVGAQRFSGRTSEYWAEVTCSRCLKRRRD